MESSVYRERTVMKFLINHFHAIIVCFIKFLDVSKSGMAEHPDYLFRISKGLNQ